MTGKDTFSRHAGMIKVSIRLHTRNSAPDADTARSGTVIQAMQDYYPVLIAAIAIGWVIFRLSLWQKAKYAYKCSRCLEQFQLSRWTDYLGPNVFLHKYVRCPQCGKWGWASLVRKESGPPHSY